MGLIEAGPPLLDWGREWGGLGNVSGQDFSFRCLVQALPLSSVPPPISFVAQTSLKFEPTASVSRIPRLQACATTLSKVV